MGKRGFIAYDPQLARAYFNADPIVAIYYAKLLRYDVILPKDSEGYFTRSTQEIEQSTCITRKQQDRARKQLLVGGYILTALKVPTDKSAPQLHFKLIDKNLAM